MCLQLKVEPLFHLALYWWSPRFKEFEPAYVILDVGIPVVGSCEMIYEVVPGYFLLEMLYGRIRVEHSCFCRDIS